MSETTHLQSQKTSITWSALLLLLLISAVLWIPLSAAAENYTTKYIKGLNVTEKQDFNDRGQMVWVDSHQVYFWDAGVGGDPLKLSVNGGLNPQLNSQGQVVWAEVSYDGWSTYYKDVYYWDSGIKGSSPRKISNNSYGPNIQPLINNQGQVVWQGYDGHDYEIYYWDAAKPVILNISNNAYDDDSPSLNARGEVVWLGTDGANPDIFYWNPLNGGAKKISNNFDEKNEAPFLNDLGQVLWRGYDRHDWEIYFRDARSQGPVYNLSNNEYDDPGSQMLNSRGEVAWVGASGPYHEAMYYWDARTPTTPAQKISESFSLNTKAVPGLNAQGHLFWAASGSLYFWQAQQAGPIKIHDFASGHEWGWDPTLILNSQGQIVFSDHEIYYWDARNRDKVKLAQQISQNVNGPQTPDLNEYGQVVWLGNDQGIDWDIYYWDARDNQAAINISANDYFDVGPVFVNNQGQIIWREFFATEAESYDFKFEYDSGRGDQYTGTFTADIHNGHYKGQTWTKTDENRKLGRYTILDVAPGKASDIGRVVVNKYYDSETKKPFDPVHKGQAVGNTGLGSELDYIGTDNVKEYQFGKGYYEADVGDKYTFKYYLWQRRLLPGRLFTALPARSTTPAGSPPQGQRNRQAGLLPDPLHGLHRGYRQIQPGLCGYLPRRRKQQRLHPGRIKARSWARLYAAVNRTTLSKTASRPTSSAKAIMKPTSATNTHSNIPMATATTTRAMFTALPGAVYYPGWKLPPRPTKPASWAITRSSPWPTPGLPPNTTRSMWILTTTAKATRTSPRSHKGQAVGTALCGSEQDYIVKDGIAAYKFGKGYYEADVGDKYAFKYTYGNGESYQGNVYRTPGEVYYPGWKSTPKANETGKLGYYQILSMAYTGATTKYNQVFVDTYHDGESNKDFTPVA